MLKRQPTTSKKIYLLIISLLSTLAMQTLSAEEKPVLNRTILLENKVDLPTKHISTQLIRVILPPAFKTPQHTHEGPGPRYVVKGKLKVVEGGKTNTYSAGDVFWESGNVMTVENLGDSAAELIIFELTPAKKM